MFSKNEKVHHISSIIAGLGILFIGMDMMGAAMEPLQESEAFINLMTQFSNPLLGILVGAVFTAVIQSSSASVGILQALAATGMIPLSSAVYVLFGQNIGTCINSGTCFYRNQSECETYDGYSSDVQYYWNSYLYSNLYGDTVCVSGRVHYSRRSGCTDRECTYDIQYRDNADLLPFGTYMARGGSADTSGQQERGRRGSQTQIYPTV